jgi:hypothetical protein
MTVTTLASGNGGAGSGSAGGAAVCPEISEIVEGQRDGRLNRLRQVMCSLAISSDVSTHEITLMSGEAFDTFNDNIVVHGESSTDTRCRQLKL